MIATSLASFALLRRPEPRTIKSMRLLTTTCIVFWGGFAIMVLEIVGARYLAIGFGASFYNWISQIGVILIAMSLGYYVGGALADRFERVTFLGWLLIPAGVFTGLIPLFAIWIMDWIVMRHPPDQSIPILWQKLDPALGSALIFLGPCFVLAMLSPAMIRVATRDVSHVGRISGLIYAASTVGSIAGVFVSGYILIDIMRLSRIFYVTGGIIVLLGVLCLGVDRWLREKEQDVQA
ncbi:fused MFS/spermidine synthase [Planctomycetota bacterium]